MSLSIESAPVLDQQSSHHFPRIVALAAELGSEINSPNRSSFETALLHVASSIDEAVQESLDGDRRLYSDLLETLLAASEGVEAQAVRAAQRLFERHAAAGLRPTSRLGVCPAVVLRALSLLMRQQATFAEVERITECDPILATSLLSQANSALYHRPSTISSVGAAVAYLGVDVSRKVILAASSRSLFASVALRGIWEHSVDVATIAEQLAASAGADASEAFVAGLVHDLGCLVLDSNEEESFVAAYRRLGRGSCRPILAEIVLTGLDHGPIGADVLAAWSMPNNIVEAVRYHHRPEAVATPLASIVYMAELVSNSEEAVPSSRRLEYAQKTTGVKDLSCVSSDLRRLSTALSMVG